MNRLLVLIVYAVTVIGCTVVENRQPKAKICSDEWYALVEKQIATGDSHGHGPDVGSTEWRSVIEFKLGIRGAQKNPPLDSEPWCEFINNNYIQSQL